MQFKLERSTIKKIGNTCCPTFLLAMIPMIYYFEVWIVLPRFYEPWSFTYLCHFCACHFILFNLCVNLISIKLVDTGISGKILPPDLGKNWRFCSDCKAVAPPRSWHCDRCKTCILKRDHHCMFTSCCIGHSNHRFFVMFLFYLFIATVYSTIFNVLFIYEYISFDSWTTIVKIVFPVTMLFLEWTDVQVYVGFIIVTIMGCCAACAVLLFQLHSIVNGVVIPERKSNLSIYDKGTVENLKVALGNKWYLVWLSPFVKSELPCDGVVWETDTKTKET